MQPVRCPVTICGDIHGQVSLAHRSTHEEATEDSLSGEWHSMTTGD